jgi:hypothetical protein|tara:strand:- start:36 stop:233 length:198 start_codon:yes stop_codon:yes gene_type:complete
MQITTTKQVFQFQDGQTDVEVSIEKKEGQPKIITFTSYETNHHLIVETGEFDELYKILTQVKSML